jgi:hypothetical protein
MGIVYRPDPDAPIVRALPGQTELVSENFRMRQIVRPEGSGALSHHLTGNRPTPDISDDSFAPGLEWPRMTKK